MNTLIRLTHYDPKWRQEFQQTRSGVLMCCLGWVDAVEHIGSTAISGLIAQPVIDVVARVSDPAGLAEATRSIEGMNFRVVNDAASGSDTVLGAIELVKPRHGQWTHRVFLVSRESTFWQNAIDVRDHLRRHREVALRFEQLKVDQWRESGAEPAGYQHSKNLFFSHLLDQINARRQQDQ